MTLVYRQTAALAAEYSTLPIVGFEMEVSELVYHDNHINGLC